MKKITVFLIAIIMILTGATAYASPYLTCDCTPAADQVTGFQLQFGTQPAIDVPALTTCGSGASLVTCATDQKLICYDLGTLPNGPFSVKALAVNLWGASAYTAPLSGIKAGPGSLPFIKIIR